MKGNDRGGEFNYDIFDIRTFENVTMYNTTIKKPELSQYTQCLLEYIVMCQ
jgi:hypothetical protein